MLSAMLIAAPVMASAAGGAQESAIEAPGPSGPLAGTLVDATGSEEPVVLIIPGSGPTDRDGNSPLGVSASTYRLLAQGLAEHGVTSVHIDKRGMFGSAGAIADPNEVTIGDYAADVHSWIGAVRERTGASCVWVVGHSEGGLVTLAAAVRSEAGICGLFLASTPGRPLGPIVREQLRANPANAPVLAEAERTLTELEAGRRVPPEQISAPLMPLFAPQVQDYVIDLLRFDPAAAISSLNVPILLIYGGRDLQVPVPDGKALAAANRLAELAVFEQTTHVLKSAADGREANLATYADPGVPLTEGISRRIADFVKSRGR
jgi:pimeloyl-ACP methyl ester carboxylesterase